MVQSPNQAIGWHQAIERYLSGLSATQRKTFTAPASADDCVELIRQAQGRKKYDRFMVALRPLIEPLKRFEGSIDVLVQAQAGIASPIWVQYYLTSLSLAPMLISVRVPCGWSSMCVSQLRAATPLVSYFLTQGPAHQRSPENITKSCRSTRSDC